MAHAVQNARYVIDDWRSVRVNLVRDVLELFFTGEMRLGEVVCQMHLALPDHVHGKPVGLLKQLMRLRGSRHVE
jgi:hypothetical protein